MREYLVRNCWFPFHRGGKNSLPGEKERREGEEGRGGQKERVRLDISVCSRDIVPVPCP